MANNTLWSILAPAIIQLNLSHYRFESPGRDDQILVTEIAAGKLPDCIRLEKFCIGK